MANGLAAHMASKQYYYHVTQRKWTKNKLLHPKNNGCHRGPAEPQCKRICVSPSVETCLVALGCCLFRRCDIFIYRTANPVLGRPSVGVVDAILTKERWLTRSTKFVRVGTIPYQNEHMIRSLFSLTSGEKSDIPKQMEHLKRLFKLKQSYIEWI